MPTSRSDRVLALDIGGTKVEAALGDASGRVGPGHKEPTHAELGFEASWSAVLRAVDAALADAPEGGIAAIGVSIGGPVDSGVVLSPPNLPGWDAIALAELLAKARGIPTFVEHDAKAGALAEHRFGVGRGTENLIFLTLGTGLGAGVILDGRLVHGRRNNLGEVGHWRVGDDGPDVYGKRGSWEGYSSGAGLASRARAVDPTRWPAGTAAREVFDAARVGDRTAVALVDDFATHLGRGIALLVDLLSPEVVALGSLAVRAGDLFLPRVQHLVDAECTARNLPCPVLPTALGERIGVLAALAVGVDGLVAEVVD